MFVRSLVTIRLFASLWLLCANLAWGVTSELIDGAKRERELVLYASLTIEEDIPVASVNRLRDAGAPIDWVALGPVPAIMVGAGITAQQPLHSNAARLYIDFILSKEGQAIMRGFHRLSARTDLAHEQAALQKDLRIVPVNPSLADHIEEYTKLLRETFSK